MNQELKLSNTHLLDEEMAEKVGVNINNNNNQQKNQRINKIRQTAGLTDEDFAKDQEMYDEAEREKIEAELERRKNQQNNIGQQKEQVNETKTQQKPVVNQNKKAPAKKGKGGLRIFGMKPAVALLVGAGFTVATYLGIKHFRKSKIKLNDKISESGIGNISA